ncbi:MAG: 3-deoxy-manno-octulosonate cytidylyltransferase [Gammaproteobacteria bacterium]
MHFRVYIPARYGSSRLPGKPLLDIAGKPMLQHVFERARESGAARVVVATDDERIKARAEAFGATVCITAPAHASGTDRIAEAATRLGEDDDAVIVNLQGDEPFMPPHAIAEVAALLARDVPMATLCTPISRREDLLDPNVVKVVMDDAGHALYFSRAPIPFARAGSDEVRAGPLDPTRGTWFRHLGLYAYRAGFLRRLCRLPVCAIEQIEALEQLRVLYHGYRIAIGIAAGPVEGGVDTPGDLARLRQRLAAASALPAGLHNEVYGVS